MWTLVMEAPTLPCRARAPSLEVVRGGVTLESWKRQLTRRGLSHASLNSLARSFGDWAMSLRTPQIQRSLCGAEHRHVEVVPCSEVKSSRSLTSPPNGLQGL